ncbi:MAG TPA: hypothetical protein VK960_07850 [Acidimicrobiia bacterium]|nr:hypothetical protein [Acidimicrobiia bacterium]
MTPTIDVLLLLALPASGKSEIRRYIEHLGPRHDQLHLRPTIQLDDYPYVHVMRRISQEQRALGSPPAFFASDETPFVDPRDWLTLIHLVNEDFAGLGRSTGHPADAGHLIDRIEAARRAAGATVPIAGDERDTLAEAIAGDAADLAAALPTPTPEEVESSTILIEFARGGPEGAVPPLPFPVGYEHSLRALSPGILHRASILYVWVTPEESRRRNRERAVPGRQGDASILHHGVPESVMRQDYGMDDIGHLAAASPVPGTIAVPSGDDVHLLPFARFDNREDHTSFLRGDPAGWPPESLARLRTDLALALEGLVGVDSPSAE